MPIEHFRVFDVETTGIPTEEERHAVCEIGWIDIRMVGGEWRVDEAPISMLVNPGRPMPIEALSVHHITDEMLAGAVPIGHGFRALMDGTDAARSCFVAHNADFEKEFFGGGDVPWICTYKSALRIWPDAPSHSNQVLRYWRNPEGLDRSIASVAHRAMPDAYVTAFLLRDMLQEAAVEDLIAWSKEPAILPKIQFGKYR